MEIVETKDLVKKFQNVVAVNGVSLSVCRGEIFGVVGPDGAGKTTLIRMLTSVMEPTGGDAWTDQKHIVKEAELIKENIGYMSQKFGLYQDLTVLENLQFYADIYGVLGHEKKRKIRELLSFSGLEEFQHRRAESLSGGMKQKLGLSCALIHTPKILFLDEPTNGVDPVSRREFWHALYGIHRQGTTIFLSTAYMDEAERCSKVAFMYRGKVLIEGSPKEVKTYLQGSVLEVRCSSSRKVLLMLKKTFGEDCVKLFGNRIHIYVYTENHQLSLKQVEDVLGQLNEGTYEVRKTEPNLEDVFMSLMREKEAEDSDVRY